MKRGIRDKGLKVNLRKSKVVVSGAEGEVSVSNNDKLSVVCEILEMDP